MGRYVEIRKTHDDADVVVYHVTNHSTLAAEVWIDRRAGTWSIPPETSTHGSMAAALSKITKQIKAGVYPEVLDFIS